MGKGARNSVTVRVISQHGGKGKEKRNHLENKNWGEVIRATPESRTAGAKRKHVDVHETKAG